MVSNVVDHARGECGAWLAERLDLALGRAMRGAGPDAAPSAPVDPLNGSADLFRLTLQGDLSRARALCDRHAAAAPGGRRAVYADLVLPTVRAIEAEWNAGSRPFEEIIAHFWSVQRLLDGLADTPALPATPGQGAVLLACPAGEDHGFGLGVVAEEFRAAGWRVVADRAGGNAGIVDLLGAESYDAVGLSVGHDGALAGLADLVQDLRIASRNPRLRVILGGNVMAAAPGSFGFLGADLVAGTGAEALGWLAQHARPMADAMQRQA